ncbi:unnamed protein product [Macrosiphum euphorbiae]|uniref:Uncharacterized protein n=1 Tax=Macrosiphum euphorbiae TaxID=13131 RepID=A0AAV0Y302_9HEMI|nr:unnamed protein product [Macrosiphum euphorbiae]
MDFGLPNGFVCLRNRMPFKVNVNFSIRQSMWAEERSRWHTTLARILDYPTFLITCGKATSSKSLLVLLYIRNTHDITFFHTPIDTD